MSALLSLQEAAPSIRQHANPCLLRIEPPLSIPSSDSLGEDNMVKDTVLSKTFDIGVDEVFDIHHETYFEDAFMSVLEDRHSSVKDLVEQERLNPVDSITRIPVPRIDLKVPEPEWQSAVVCPRHHLSWLQVHSKSLDLPILPKDRGLEAMLKWVPVPAGKKRLSINEEALYLNQSTRNLLAIDTLPVLGDEGYIPRKANLTILDVIDDEEIGIHELASIDHICSQNVLQSHVNETSQALKMITPYVATVAAKNADQVSRRDVLGTVVGVLPQSRDTGTTSRLLSGFMELRAVKRRRIGLGDIPSPSARTQPDQSKSLSAGFTVCEQASKETDAFTSRTTVPSPVVNVPIHRSSFVISINIGRSVLHYIEAAWGRERLIDRDFSRYNLMAWSPGTARPKQMISPLSFEADISLTPAAGIIMTNLLKVRQRPLPDSKAQTPLRERVRRVSTLYQSLLVLVSVANIDGDGARNPSSSDLAAYADFVRYTLGVDGDVSTFLVPGPEAALSGWVLSAMCQCSSQSFGHQCHLLSAESTWEVFLRRAGMNVVAAQVLAGLLRAEFDSTGLARYLAIGVEERLDRYAEALGTRKNLWRSGEVLNQTWG